MSEEENMDVVEVVQPQETETVQEFKEPIKGSAEYNFRETRKLIEQQSREIQELKQREYERSVAHKEEPKDELEGLGQEDYLTRKQAEALALRKAQELLAQQEYNTAEDRVRMKYRDYDDVVTDENIEQLIKDSPRLANLIKSSDNPYLDAYDFIKQSASFQQKSKKHAPDVDKVVKNSQKPISANAVQARPLASAHSYALSNDEERRAAYNEMMGYANRR